MQRPCCGSNKVSVKISEMIPHVQGNSATVKMRLQQRRAQNKSEWTTSFRKAFPPLAWFKRYNIAWMFWLQALSLKRSRLLQQGRSKQRQDPSSFFASFGSCDRTKFIVIDQYPTHITHLPPLLRSHSSWKFPLSALAPSSRQSLIHHFVVGCVSITMM